MKDDTIRTTGEFWEIVRGMVSKNDVSRIALCSVGEVMKRGDAEDRHQRHIVYRIHLYYGPFCVWKDRRKFNMKIPVYMDRHDVIQFIAKALSDKKSPYRFNPKTGKWDHVMMVM